MPNRSSKTALATARAALATPVDFDTFLAKLAPKERLNAERHVAACEAEDPRHAATWRRLACALMTLAPHAVKLNSQQSAQFYVPDGKYRMQVFALEDLRDGNVNVYCGDVLKEAIQAGALTVPKKGGEPNAYKVAGAEDMLVVEPLDRTIENPAAFFKDMIGWNRKALRIVVPNRATVPQLEAAETICSISARAWTAAAARPA